MLSGMKGLAQRGWRGLSIFLNGLFSKYGNPNFIWESEYDGITVFLF